MTPSRAHSQHPAVSASEMSVTRGSGRRATQVLHELSFDIPAGSITGLLGPSGCGKTTLMRAVSGLQKFTGRLEVLDHAAGEKDLRGRIGYVTQSPSLYPELTVEENLRYFALLSGGDTGEVLTRLGLEETRHKQVAQLSGGQRGRASLGCALVGDPELLVMDEPTVGLDPVVRAELWEQFRELADAGDTLLVSSHVMEEASHCDQLILMRKGLIVWQGTPSELLAQTGASSYEGAFLSAIESSHDSEGST
ncbi:ABC transporter ATP-binding protein [Corynebacterium alimapuense]|uniref:Multidrug ABC transporter ATP-binding protein n=1 Tax=Corynebacterium alimapuense TaxID=1576874 RepID=A0A3M8K784_9CORY|nr:ABC transporter ATP-binding protein [Corynebacterium alimapuense]RNE48374.1 multidrug ABC transporter ATP-binding protein [Corynebacterium alimapuense]